MILSTTSIRAETPFFFFHLYFSSYQFPDKNQTKEVVQKTFQRLWTKIEEEFNSKFEIEGMDPVEPLNRDLVQKMQEIDERVENAVGRIREIREEVFLLVLILSLSISLILS